MSDKLEELRSLLEGLEAACAKVGLPVREVLKEKSDELAIRDFLRCLPGKGIKESQWPSFLRDVLNADPGTELLERIRREARESVLDAEEYKELERLQGSRCALCGTILRQTVRPHVDHKIPVALGGKSDKANMQLLCQECNLGKSKLLGWIMGAPFLDEGLTGVTGRLRYCVLTRDNACCCVPECMETSRTAELIVIARVPVSRGGRLIFDNLRVMCRGHGDGQVRTWKEEAYTRYRGLASLAWDRSRRSGAVAVEDESEWGVG